MHIYETVKPRSVSLLVLVKDRSAHTYATPDTEHCPEVRSTTAGRSLLRPVQDRHHWYTNPMRSSA